MRLTSRRGGRLFGASGLSIHFTRRGFSPVCIRAQEEGGGGGAGKGLSNGRGWVLRVVCGIDFLGGSRGLRNGIVGNGVGLLIFLVSGGLPVQGS